MVLFSEGNDLELLLVRTGRTRSLSRIEHQLHFFTSFDRPDVFSGRDGVQDGDGDLIHMGHAILTFYSALIDLLGRCAPEMHVSVFSMSAAFTPQQPLMPGSTAQRRDATDASRSSDTSSVHGTHINKRKPSSC